MFKLVFTAGFLFILFTTLYSGSQRDKVNKKSDYTTINLATDDISKILLMIQDSLGRKTGCDDSDGKYQREEIPNSVCFIDGIADDVTGVPPEKYSEIIKISHMTGGTYHLFVKGKQTGPFEINLMAVATDNSLLKFNIDISYELVDDCIFKGQIQKGETKHFTLTYDPTPGTIVIIKEIKK